MRLGNIVLAVAASMSITVGATFQGSSNQSRNADSYAHRLFAKAKADDFLGSKACAECHEAKSVNFTHSGHATFVMNPALPADKQGCESCHGPGALHLKDEDSEVISFTKLSPKESSAACLRCHSDVMTASQWHRTVHSNADVACVSCHQIHPEETTANIQLGERDLVKREVYPSAKPSHALLKGGDEAKLCATCHQKEAMQFKKPSHHPLPEGKLLCSDCHSLHPTKTSFKDVGANTKDGFDKPAAKRTGLGKQMCVTCHTNHAGPFIFEHDPVAGNTGEGCVECHDPHGSHNPKLLNGFSRGLCAKCHTEKLAGHFPGRTCWSAGCHVAVHGSNSSPRLLSK
jgi:predicted CXXCH cytochrome family protein